MCDNKDVLINWEFPSNKMEINNDDYYIQSLDALKEIYELLDDYISDEKGFM